MNPSTNTQPQESRLPQEAVSDTRSLVELIEMMSTVDLNDPDAELNATTISDGKGGRILL